MRSSSEPESDRLALALARRKRLAEIGTKRENRSRARARQKHGVEQSTAPSRAAAARDDGSSGVRALELQVVSAARDPKIFGLRRCGLAPEARNFLGTRHAEKMVASMTFMTSKSSRIVVSKVYGVNTDVKCAILVTIMQS